MTDLLALVRAADPAPAAHGSAPPDDAARAVLASILATPPSAPAAAPARRAPRALLRAGLAGAAVAAAVAAYLVVPADTAPRAYADTPPMLDYDSASVPARAVLLALAARAESQPRPAPGRYDYVRTRGWSLSTFGVLEPDGPNAAPPRYEHYRAVTDQRFWLADDGSGRVDVDETFVEGSRPPAFDMDAVYKPGERGGRTPVPADRDGLRRRVGHQDGWDAGNWLDAVSSIWGEKVVEPEEQATLLRALAGVRGVVFRGRVTDRVGREGLVISGDSDWGGFDRRVVLVLDPRTGALLDAESIALESAEMPIKPPATIGYAVFLESRRVESTETR